MSSIPRLFFKLTTANRTDRLDPVLSLPLYTLTNKSIIVGLPGIGQSKLYIIPVIIEDGALTRHDGATDLLVVTWNLQYL
jgi:hypothetical protein